jgi:hypothetical protein
MATHINAVCKNCCNEINPETTTYDCGNKCKNCYNEYRRNRYNSDESYRLKSLNSNLENAKNRRKIKAVERKQTLEDERKSLEEKIGSENRICKVCNNTVLKTRFRTGRLRCKDCENENDRKRSSQVAARHLHRLHTDPIFKFKHRQRTQILQYLKKSSIAKDRRTNEYLGCSSSQYYDWLKYNSDIYTFENHGQTWHIDHVIPLSHFDFEDREQQLIAFNWSNTMPLSIEENLTKGSTILISQIKQHKEKLLNYFAICGLTIPTKYIELIDSHVIKLTGNSLEPILPPHNGNIMGELG